MRVVGDDPAFEVVDQRFVGEADGAAERIAEQFAGKLGENGVATRRQEITSKSFQALQRRAVGGLGEGVDGVTGEVFIAAAADRVEAFEREAEAVDPRVAAGAVASRLCFSTSCRTERPPPLASSSGNCGTPLGGLGSFSPSKTSETQLPRRIGLVRDAPDCFARVVGEPENAAAARGADAFDTPPIGAADAGNAVKLGHAFIQDRGVGSVRGRIAVASRWKRSWIKRIVSSYISPRKEAKSGKRRSLFSSRVSNS